MPGKNLQRAEVLRRGKDRIDQAGGEGVGDHHLLEEARGDQSEGGGPLYPAGVMSLLQLGEKLRTTNDRAGDQMREERDEHRKVEQGDRFELAAVDIDRVAE